MYTGVNSRISIGYFWSRPPSRNFRGLHFGGFPGTYGHVDTSFEQISASRVWGNWQLSFFFQFFSGEKWDRSVPNLKMPPRYATLCLLASKLRTRYSNVTWTSWPQVPTRVQKQSKFSSFCWREHTPPLDFHNVLIHISWTLTSEGYASSLSSVGRARC